MIILEENSEAFASELFIYSVLCLQIEQTDRYITYANEAI